MSGVPINSLQDLLMLRELKKQNLESRPLFSAMKALSDGVALGIAEQQEKAKQKKKQEETLSFIKQAQNTNNSKITTKINDKGEVDYTIEPRDPIDSPDSKYKLAQAEYQSAMAEIIRGGDATPDDINNMAQGGVPTSMVRGTTIPSDEDYIETVETRNWRGIPRPTKVRKLKPALPQTAEKEYRGFMNTKLGLEQNLRMLAENPKFKNLMTPFNISAHRPGGLIGDMGQILLKIDPKSKEFATFKAETDKVFQTFRKETTGANAALKELGWLAPDFPETTDNDELYRYKAVEAIKRIEEGQNLLKELWSPNYRTSHLNKTLDVSGDNVFTSEEKAISANLPKGTQIIINGRRAVVQ